MIGNQRPRIDRGFGSENQITETSTESLPIAVAHKDGSALDAPHHDVVKHSHGIKSGPTRHTTRVATDSLCVNYPPGFPRIAPSAPTSPFWPPAAVQGGAPLRAPWNAIFATSFVGHQ